MTESEREQIWNALNFSKGLNAMLHYALPDYSLDDMKGVEAMIDDAMDVLNRREQCLPQPKHG